MCPSKTNEAHEIGESQPRCFFIVTAPAHWKHELPSHERSKDRLATVPLQDEQPIGGYAA
jgi:hypothetical protein